MEVVVKVRFNASKERIERFGNDRYLMYLPFEEDEDAEQVLITLLSRYLGVPANRVEFKCFNSQKDRVFVVS